MVILNFDCTTQQQTQCVSKGGFGQNHLCEVHTATSNLRQTISKSQVLKGISLTGGVQHCNSKANLWLAKLMKQDSGKYGRAELPLTT